MMLRSKLTWALTLFTLVLLLEVHPQKVLGDKIPLVIYHYNDIQGHLQPFLKGSKPPKECGGSPFDCIGGLSPLIGTINDDAKKLDDPIIKIGTGNLVGGSSGWIGTKGIGYEAYGKLIADIYKPDLIGLGLRDFEAGLPRTNIYLKNAATKAIISNLAENCNTVKGAPEKEFCEQHTEPFRIQTVTSKGKKYEIGIVGFVNPLVEKLSEPGQLKFEDVTSALKKIIESPKLKNLKTIIAIGSGNVEIAKSILDNVDRVKLVVYAGGSQEALNDNYPMKQNEKIFVMANHFGEKVGRLTLEIDTDSGNLVVNEKKSILIDVNQSSHDGPAGDRVDQLLNLVKTENQEPVGQSLVKLEGSRSACWASECNLGNLVTDAMVQCTLKKLFSTGGDGSKIPNISGLVGVWQSGSLVNDIIDVGGKIYNLDIHKWLPYSNRVYLVTVTGATIKKMFETSGKAIQDPEKSWGRFLQVSSGLEVTYSTSGDLKSIRTHHVNDSKTYKDRIQDEALYPIVIPSFMYNGRGVWDFLPGSFKPFVGDKIDIGFDDICLKEHIQALQVLKVGFDDRILMNDDGSPFSKKCSSNTGLTIFLTLLISAIIIGSGYASWAYVLPAIQRRRRATY